MIKYKYIKHTAITTLVLVLSAASASATISHTIMATTTDDTTAGGYSIADATPRSIFTADQAGYRVSVGTAVNGDNCTSVFVFKLPDLGAYTFVSAQLDWSGILGGGAGVPPLVNIVGLRIGNSNVVTTADFDNTAATTILSDLGISQINGQTDYENTNLNNWISTNYTAGDYVVIGFRGQTNPGGTDNRWLLDRNPVLRINDSQVPEPATYALIFGALALGFVMLRRRFKA